MTLAPSHQAVVHSPRERLFSVGRKSQGYHEVRAETAQIQPSGALVFQNGAHLVIAFAPNAWTTLEECEDE